MATDYDAIIVGARCAGAPTAMLLAQQGHRVLLVDKATFPSDTLSTLLIHTTGVAALRRWGVLDDVVASGCPPIDTYAFDFGPVVISGSPHPVDGSSVAYAPRRTVLDKILLDAAAAAGAEVREGFSVEEILIEDGTVVGVRGRTAGGATVTERAAVVVGADGWNSQVARAIDAPRYNEKPVLEHAFYTFWSGLPFDEFTTFIRGETGGAAIPTNDGLTLLLFACPFDQAAAFRSDVEANYLRTAALIPELADRLGGATREERYLGGGVPNFFRKPYGPGWALVGDAGYTRDPITAQGISDALRGAEACATALHDALAGIRPFDEAMAQYHQDRDAQTMALYEYTTELAALEPPPPEMEALIGSIAGNQAAMDAFVSVTAGTVSPADFFAPESIGALLGEPATAVAPA